MNKDELTFIAGDFSEFEIPRDKQYLFRYFKTDLEQQFLKYLYCFGDYENFVEHTGHYCQHRWLHVLKRRHDIIVSYYQDVKKDIFNSDDDLDFNVLVQIEKGKIKVSRNFYEN